jgi:hypothetical protein
LLLDKKQPHDREGRPLLEKKVKRLSNQTGTSVNAQLPKGCVIFGEYAMLLFVNHWC